MRVGLLGRKVGMTQIYQEDGIVVPVTVLECGPCTVLQVRTEERDGYHAVQLGFDDKKRKNATQAERGHAKKVDAEPKRYVREIRQDGAGRRRPRADPDRRALQRDQARRCHRHQQGAGLRGRHQAARLQRPAGHARRQADAPPSRLLRAQRRPVADPARASASRASSATPASRSGTSRSSGSTRPTTCSCSEGAVPGPNGGYLTVRQTNKV